MEISGTQWLICMLFGFVSYPLLSQTNKNLAKAIEEKEITFLEELFDQQRCWTDDFRLPVGKPEGRGYYNAQGFGDNLHLGDDWNGNGGGNSDLGDTVRCVGPGLVVFAKHCGVGWGNVVRVVHRSTTSPYEWVESVYAHLDTMLVGVGDWLVDYAVLGTIGNADGAYWAHLHLELRSDIHLPLGGGYGQNTTGYLDPEAFIKEN